MKIKLIFSQIKVQKNLELFFVLLLILITIAITQIYNASREISKKEYINLINKNKNFLGICLGMQLLFEESEEFGVTKGIGFFNGKVENFNKYNSDFLKKINLKYVVLCENLSVSEIDAGGVPNHRMKTLIINIKFHGIKY